MRKSNQFVKQNKKNKEIVYDHHTHILLQDDRVESSTIMSACL